MYIGIGESDQLVFEGSSTYGAYVIWPRPLLTPAKFVFDVSSETQLTPAEISSFVSAEYLFREDAFDPVTRIRRGRFYKRKQGAQPEHWTVMVSPPLAADTLLLQKRAVTFEPLIPSELDVRSNQQLLVILGAERSFNIWTVANKEAIHTREVLVTLKSRKSFGVLPEIDLSKLTDENHMVRGKIEALLDDVFRAGAESIVDRAREAATAILSAYLQSDGVPEANGKDLGALIELLEKQNGKHSQRIVRCAAEIPQRLHSRAKHAEQEKHDGMMRVVTEQDAELAVQCIGVMLCDLGWASWS